MTTSERSGDGRPNAPDPAASAGPDQAATAAPAGATGAPATATAADRTTGRSDRVRRIPLRGVAARLVTNMAQSLEVPTATSFRDIPAAVLAERRASLNEVLRASPEPRKLSLTHLIAFAIVQAAIVHPGMAAFFAEIDGSPNRMEPEGIGLGLAVDVEGRDGTRFLVVPVVHRADEMDFGSFVAAYDDLIERARTNRLRPNDLAGATITLTNPGTVGTTASVPRLMSGQGAIVATGAIRSVGGERLMTVTSTYDHRVIQGAESGRFLRTLDELLQGADGFYEYAAETLGLTLPPQPGAATPAPDARRAEPIAEQPVTPPSSELLQDVASGAAIVRTYRQLGHKAAHLDPLGTPPPGDPALSLERWGLTEEATRRVPARVLRVFTNGETLANVLDELRDIYAGTTAYEVEHISSDKERTWLRRAIESRQFRQPLTQDEKRNVLRRLTQVEALERFLGRAYLGQKRFSIEGLDILVPMLDELIRLLADGGAKTVEIGMPHRGRLNVLAHIVGVPYEQIVEDFERSKASEAGEPAAPGETSDVKYHRGAEGVYRTPGGEVQVVVSSNPSHLEAVDPVVQGRTRARQTDRTPPTATHDPCRAVPVLIHGDASFAAQGVVAETLNLARLPGYSTGGTIHLVGDNQLGFTTGPNEARSTDYASDLAKGFDIPIVHVNADDPEACLDAVRLAVAYREEFEGDVVVHVVGYRRQGHNEEDEPAYTQPQMYERIRALPTVRARYLERLAREGAVPPAEGDEMLRDADRHLAEVQEKVAAERHKRERERRVPHADGTHPETAVAVDRLRSIEEGLLRWPSEFTVSSKLARQLERRRAAAEAGGPIAWAQAEALAFGSLLEDGVPIRLTGQDTERGTFSQRHLALFEVESGTRFAPIEHLDGAKASIELHNSPLSEFACLGFEYGYAVEAPDALVLWEAQYGDFTNEAEVIVDQFIIAGLAKWGLTSRLTLLLPHGYEGQGPEHSSARLERFLALGAEGNIRVANCSTPAQYFHLLRDQARRSPARPLVLMTPKSLLRLPAASSTLEELASGGFRPVLDDPERSGQAAAAVRRLVLCSGRIYHDLLASPRRASAAEVAIGRVELLYPFPSDPVARLAASYPGLETVVWVQEEPWNMGARKFVAPEILRVIPSNVKFEEVSRPERSSPAEGYTSAHRAEQARIVERAFGDARAGTEQVANDKEAAHGSD